MAEIERTIITIRDLESMADAITGALTLVHARDLETAALRMSPAAPSTLGLELQRILDRVEGLLQEHYAELGRAASESPNEAEEELEPLPEEPLGRPQVKRAADPWDFHAQGAEKDQMFERGGSSLDEDDAR